MTFFNYKQQAIISARFKNQEQQLMCSALGLCGEAGEVAEKIKKHLRDGTELDAQAVALELGDVLWYIMSMADVLGFSLDDISRMNLDKLRARMQNDTIHGSGDNR